MNEDSFGALCKLDAESPSESFPQRIPRHKKANFMDAGSNRKRNDTFTPESPRKVMKTDKNGV